MTQNVNRIRETYMMIQNAPNPEFPEYVQEWLQLDAGGTFRLYALHTQGIHGTVEGEKVLSYGLSTSLDGVTWTEYKVGGVLKIFDGNIHTGAGPDYIHVNVLSPTLITRFVRIYPKSWIGQPYMRAGLSGCPTHATIGLPDSPRLLSQGGQIRTLKACFATRRTGANDHLEFIELDQKVKIVPEPSDPLRIVEKIKGEVWGIDMLLTGEAMEAQEGDFLWIQKFHCGALLENKEGYPLGPSSRITFGSGGTISAASVYNARLNELNLGAYRMCVATKESGGDHNMDYHALTTSLALFNEAPYATLTVPYIAGLGQEIHVSWSLNGVKSKGQDWVALYRKGACRQADYTENNPYPVDEDEAQRYAQNQCHLATESIPAFVSSGTVSFQQSDYKNAGEYEVRYFFGNSHSGQGVVCRGKGGLAEGYEGSPTYKTCALEAKAMSNTIKVTAAVQGRLTRKKSSAAVHHLPGLEHGRNVRYF